MKKVSQEVVMQRLQDVAITAGGFFAGRMAIGYGDEMLKPKEGEKAGFLAKYGAPVGVTTVGVGLLATQDDARVLQFSAGLAASGTLAIASRAMGDAKPDAGKAAKAVRAALGEPAPSQPATYTPTFEVTETADSDTRRLPDAVGESHHESPANDYDHEPASSEDLGATYDHEDDTDDKSY